MTHVSASIVRRVCALAMLALAVPSALAQGRGLTLGDEAQFGPRLQARIGLNTSTTLSDGSQASWQTQAGVLLGDYYFSRARLGEGQVSSGFRATSGVLLGQRSLALGTPAMAGTAQAMSVTLVRQPRWVMGGSESAAEAWAATPYVGIGWTGTSVRGGWGVSADLGFVGRSSGNGGLRVNGNQSLDDLLRELRISPMVQVGVSYAF
jgi:hypothetical protein